VRIFEAVLEVPEINEVNGGVAAFFDLDGTLVALPSLEQRLFHSLRYQQVIGATNYFFWLKEAARLMPLGISAILHANKMYLRGVRNLDYPGEQHAGFSDGNQADRHAEEHASIPSRRNPRLPVPIFFPQAIETLAWHAKQAHELVLVTGTLEPLARKAALALEAELAARGIAVTIRVCATRLEQMGDRWTGRILGEAMFGEAKARAAERLASELCLDLLRSYAYGDSTNDRWLLESVGKQRAVNPSAQFALIARARRWPILNWDGKESVTQRRIARSERTAKEEKRSASAQRFLV
jgi:HAD superfamily phosphoserine phosphatase-like hydrolase